MQIVIAEHHAGLVSERTHEAQHRRGLRPTIHKIAGKPQLIARRIEVNLIQQPQQRIEAALQIANRVSGHRLLFVPRGFVE
jgi:hypothetical protein